MTRSPRRTGEVDVFSRLLRYGTVVIVGTGGTREPFSGIAHPLDFRNRVQAQINRAAEGMFR